MSEYLTHVAVIDDATRIAQRSPRVAEPVRQSLAQHSEWARTGSMTRENHLYVVRLLSEYRDALQAGTASEAVRKRLAFVHGWIAHRAADVFVKAGHRAIDPEHEYFEPERRGSPVGAPRLWNDIELYREAYDDGARGYFPPAMFSRDLRDHPAAGALDVSAVEPVIQAEWQADIAALWPQVVAPGAPLADRLGALLDVRQDYYVDLGRYADRIERPDPEERQRFTTATRFYDADDPLIQIAAAERAGRVPTGDLAAALDRAEAEGSQYAQMLALTMRWFAIASDFLTSDMAPQTLTDRMELQTRWGGPDSDVAAMGESLHQTILDR